MLFLKKGEGHMDTVALVVTVSRLYILRERGRWGWGNEETPCNYGDMRSCVQLLQLGRGHGCPRYGGLIPPPVWVGVVLVIGLLYV